MSLGLKCHSCSAEFDYSVLYECPLCNGVLDVKYDYENIRMSNEFTKAFCKQYESMWRFACVLPLVQHEAIVSLGEGNTPLTKSQELGYRIGIRNLFMKNESTNPTASFKDRPVSVGISLAKQFGAKGIVVASSGNASASTAAYAARAGFSCLVVVPEGTTAAKVSQAQTCGATVVSVPGPYSNSYKIAKAASEHLGLTNLATTFLNPFTVEGNKTVAFELWEQLGHRVPDWVVVPIGAGPLLVGILKGFEELKMLGVSDRVPSMIGVQSEAVHPIEDAFLAGCNDVKEWLLTGRTVAGGIADPLIGYSKDGTLTLDAIKRSGGHCLHVNDDEVLDMGRELAQVEGLFVEPTSATAIAAIKRLTSEGLIRKDDTTVAILTGHGLKTVDAYLTVEASIPVIDSLSDILKLN